MKRVKADQVLYIKLGRGGKWEDRCLNGGLIRIDYSLVDHKRALESIAGNWAWLRESYPYPVRSKGAISSHVNQVRRFYEAGAETVWITLASNHLWWCRVMSPVEVDEDGGRIRRSEAGWRKVDRKGNALTFERLSGRVLATQGFQGTICGVQEREYVLLRLNGEEPPLFKEARSAVESLEAVLAKVIQQLHWKDFEILIDLLFRQAGIRRIGGLGEAQKSVDLELLAPVTDQRISVQVKSRASIQQVDSFRAAVTEAGGTSLAFFAVHTPSAALSKRLENYGEEDEEARIVILTPEVLAKWAVRYGLSEWIIDKAG